MVRGGGPGKEKNRTAIDVLRRVLPAVLGSCHRGDGQSLGMTAEKEAFPRADGNGATPVESERIAMKQTQFAVQNYEEFYAELEKIRQWCRGNLCASVVFHIMTRSVDENTASRLLDAVREEIPEAVVVGWSTDGTIINGAFSEKEISGSCMLFEYPSTRTEVIQYPFSAEAQKEIGEKLLEEIGKRPWVKAVELVGTTRGCSVRELCETISGTDRSIRIFGGAALSSDLEKNSACIFSSHGGFMKKGLFFLLYGGENIYFDTHYVTGWKPLGSFFRVTAAEGNILKEINGLPAYETYRKYLHIQNDANFLSNTREFPFFCRLNGIDILRAPIRSNPDGSITMSTDMGVGEQARLAYGDPQSILDSVWHEAGRLQGFTPDVIFVFSCAGRKVFWGKEEIGKETEGYQMVAPTFGFYTAGEFLRTNQYLNLHNETQVIVALREGDARKRPEKTVAPQKRSQEGKISMIRRLAAFIKVTTEELEEANSQLQEANRKLSELAVVDTLTGVGNKNAYFERTRSIDRQIADGEAAFAVAIFDLNGLKAINDSFGHEIGDLAICEAAKTLVRVFRRENVYRIGGDEFITVIPKITEKEMKSQFLALEEEIARSNEGRTDIRFEMSKGFSVYSADRDADYKSVMRKADERMYRDKANYYRTHKRYRG